MLRILFTGGLAILLCGCASYRLGPSTGETAGARSVQVKPFENRTIEPRLSDALTVAVRRQLQRDATYSLATRGDGDIILNATLLRYHRQEVSLQRNDAFTARDYRLTLTAQVKAQERATGRVLFDQAVTAHTLMRFDTDLSSAERQALPMLADDLAKQIASLLTDGAF